MNYRPRPRVVPITAPSFPTLPRPQIYRKIAYTFVALVVVVVVGVLWLSSVRADVTISVRRMPLKLDTSVEVAKVAQQGQLPGRVVQGVFEKIQTFDTNTLLATIASSTSVAVAPALVPVVTPTSTSASPDQIVRAKGTVKIINNYSRAQTLVKTTRLLTEDNKLYHIDKTIVVPSKGSMTVSVYADKQGSEFVIGPSKFTIPGLFVDLQKFIYAESDTAFEGVPEKAGTVPVAVTPTPKPATKSSQPVVTAAAIDLAQRQLMDGVLAQAKQTLGSEISDPKFNQPVYVVRLIDKGNSVSAGSSADKFLASIKIDVTAVYFSKEDMASFLRAKMKERVPEGREFISFDESGVSYSLDATDTKSESGSVRVIADAAYQITATNPALSKEVITGKTKDQAITILKAVDGVSDVSIQLHPGWVTKVPTLKDHVNLIIK
ncbi:MAG: hypothetical protein Q7R83_04705 [bacterium]|nr:hypothetical protein [bacterium]